MQMKCDLTWQFKTSLRYESKKDRKGPGKDQYGVPDHNTQRQLSVLNSCSRHPELQTEQQQSDVMVALCTLTWQGFFAS